MKFSKQFLSPRGFTLVELLVTLALFTMVITLAVGALFSAQAINSKLQQTQVILDGVNLATELIARDVRYGSSFYCSNGTSSPVASLPRLSCSEGNTVLLFKPAIPLSASNSLNDRVAYYLANGALFKQEYPEGNAASSPLQITTSDVTITSLTFRVIGAEAVPADYNQPIVTISIAGVTRPAKQGVEPVHFTLQTSSTSRVPDN